MIDEDKTELIAMDAPYGKFVRLEDIAYDNGMHVLRVTIREGTRITQMDLDTGTAKTWAECMSDWADKHS